MRVLRGILAAALTWAVVWVPFSLIPFGLAALFGANPPVRVLGMIAVDKAITGAISGAAFAGLLAVAGRRRTFETLSLPWFAALGAAGGVLLPLAMRVGWIAITGVAIPLIAVISGVITSALLGAGCASLTLSIARRAPALQAADRLEEIPALQVPGAGPAELLHGK